jgi:predicted branched-subunit amino acid permease
MPSGHLADFRDGLVKIAPLIPAVIPFGLVCGAGAANVGLEPAPGIAMSVRWPWSW